MLTVASRLDLTIVKGARTLCAALEVLPHVCPGLLRGYASQFIVGTGAFPGPPGISELLLGHIVFFVGTGEYGTLYLKNVQAARTAAAGGTLPAACMRPGGATRPVRELHKPHPSAQMTPCVLHADCGVAS